VNFEDLSMRMKMEPIALPMLQNTKQLAELRYMSTGLFHPWMNTEAPTRQEAAPPAGEPDGPVQKEPEYAAAPPSPAPVAQPAAPPPQPPAPTTRQIKGRVTLAVLPWPGRDKFKLSPSDALKHLQSCLSITGPQRKELMHKMFGVKPKKDSHFMQKHLAAQRICPWTTYNRINNDKKVVMLSHPEKYVAYYCAGDDKCPLRGPNHGNLQHTSFEDGHRMHFVEPNHIAAIHTYVQNVAADRVQVDDSKLRDLARQLCQPCTPEV
jgi:hypothetical protein